MRIYFIDRADDCGCTLGQDVGLTEYTGWVVSLHPDCPEHNDEVANGP